MTDLPGIPIRTALRRPFLVRLGAGVFILNLLVGFMAADSLRKGLRSHQDRARASAQNLALVLDHHVADALKQADTALLAVQDEVGRLEASPGGGRRGLEAFLRRQHERRPGLVALRTTDAQGIIADGSGPALRGQISLADRDYFIRLREDRAAGLVISRPVLGRVSPQWMILAARRLDRPDGSFGGIAYAALGLEQLQQAFAALDMGAGGSVALRDLDLGLVVRQPEPRGAGTAVGERVVSEELRAFARSGQSAGSYRATTPFDRVARTFSVRRVSSYPFYLVVGLAERDYLQGWRRDAAWKLAEVGLFLGLSLGASWLLYRAWLREQAAHANLERLLAEVKTLGGMLPICSHCKKIRDDKGYWNQIEAYLNERIDAEFTHGICPDCAREVFPGRSGKHDTV